MRDGICGGVTELASGSMVSEEGFACWGARELAFRSKSSTTVTVASISSFSYSSSRIASPGTDDKRSCSSSECKIECL